MKAAEINLSSPFRGYNLHINLLLTLGCLLILCGEEIIPQASPKLTPLDPAFIKYQELPAEKQKVFGYIPVPVQYRAGLSKQYKYRDDLPNNYDMRKEGKVTPVQDQSSSPLCWAFSSIGAIESQILIELGMKSDISEKCLEQFKQKHYLTEGGNYQISNSYYTSGEGPVYETDDCTVTITPIDIKECNYTVKTLASSGKPVYGKATKADTSLNSIKRLIYESGAVATTLYFDNVYYDFKKYTYFCDSVREVNHSGLLVGWNDTMHTAASMPGVWIVKNSWGTSFGDSGYYYLSYYDSVALRGENALWKNITDHDTSGYIYMNDQLGGISTIGFDNYNYAYGLAKFITDNSLPITKILTWTLMGGADVSIWIYDDFDGFRLTGLLSESLRNRREYAGYSYYDLKVPLYLPAGDDFYVKVKYEYTSSELYPVPCEMFIKNYCNPIIQYGKYWIGLEDNSWYQMGGGSNYLVNLSIRAYAEPVNSEWITQTNQNKNNLWGVYFPGGNNGYAVGDAGTILKTTDGGTTWESRPGGTNNSLVSVFFTDENNGWIVGDNGTILKTADAGETWAAQQGNTSLLLGEVYFTDNSTGYIAGRNGTILKTTDKGNNWISKNCGSISNLNYIKFTDPNTGWATGWDGTILKTTDAGETWNKKYTNTINSITSVCFPLPDTGWAVADNGTLLKSADAGENWILQPCPTNQNLYSIWFCSKDTGWIFGDKGTILKTTDGGCNWEFQPSGTKYLLYSVCFADSNTGFAVGQNGTILKHNAGPLTAVEDFAAAPEDYFLYQNYPNPFNPLTTIKFSMRESGFVSLKIFNSIGEEIETLVSNNLEAGTYNYSWNAGSLASGIYIYRIVINNSVDGSLALREAKKLILLK